jgi:hypothetical protein
LEAVIASLVDFSHASSADLFEDFIVAAEAGTRGERTDSTT